MSLNTAKGAAPAGGPAGTADGGARVSLQNLSRHFGSTRALDGLTLEIEPGELVALLGPSGCGKTTALRILAGFETSDSGSVTVDGRDVSHIAPAKRDMGMVFQNYSLFPNMSALDNVAFGLRVRGRDAAVRRRVAGELLDMVGLAERANRYPHQLSGGQQQRVALARALAIEPSVLLLDEPLSALDAKVRLQLREQIRTLQTRLGTTTLFVTHDQEEALSMADRVGVMRAGRLEQIATPCELYARPSTAFVAEFVGTNNFIEDPAGTMCIRPERIGISRTPHEGAEPVQLVAAEFLGPVARYIVQRPDGTTLKVLDTTTADRLAVGDAAWIGWDPDACYRLP